MDPVMRKLASTESTSDHYNKVIMDKNQTINNYTFQMLAVPLKHPTLVNQQINKVYQQFFYLSNSRLATSNNPKWNFPRFKPLNHRA